MSEDSAPSPIDEITFPHDTPWYWSDLEEQAGAIKSFQAELRSMTAALGPNFKSIDTQSFDKYKSFVSSHTAISDAVEPTEIESVNKGLKDLNGIRMHLDTEFEKWGISNREEEKRMTEYLEREEELMKLKLKYIGKVKTYLTTKINKQAGKDKVSGKETKMRGRKQEMALLRIDLVHRYRSLQMQKEMMVLEPLMANFRAYQKFFQEGQALLEPLKPTIDKLEEYTTKRKQEIKEQTAKLDAVKAKFEEQAKEDKRIDKSTMFVGATGIRDLDAAATRGDTSLNTDTVKKGYLFMQKPQFARVWCELDGEKFSVLHSKVTEDDVAKGRLEKMTKVSLGGPKLTKQNDIVLPCQLCTVKETQDAVFAFEFSIISATGQKVTLQADSLEGLKEWVATIQNAISQGLAGGSTSSKGQAEDSEEAKAKKAREAEEQKAIEDQLKTLRAVPGNDQCADCGNKDPEWVSMNLGIMMCISCSGVHRSMGVHISKVRSSALDRFDPFLMNTLCSVGNLAALEAWEGKLQKSDKLKKSHKPNNSSKNWIKAKYEKKSFVAKPPEPYDPNSLLFQAIENVSPVELLTAIALGADLNAKNPEQENRTAAHHAVMYGDQRIVDLVIQNDADLRTQESRGWTPLHYAAYQDDPDLCALLLLRGGSNLAVLESKDGVTPLNTSIAYCEEGEPKCKAVLEEALEKVALKLKKSMNQP